MNPQETLRAQAAKADSPTFTVVNDPMGAHLVAPTQPERAEVNRRGERQPISKLTRTLVYRRDRWTCQRCGRKAFALKEDERSGALQLDHIVPWSAGGSDRSDNLRTLCKPCNETRSNFVADTDKAATPCVRICAPCLSVVDERIARALSVPVETFPVYCGSRNHMSWAIPGWSIL